MLKVLFAASEATPMAKVGGLADVAGALPKALKRLGVDVRLIIPKYRPIETPGLLPGSQVPVYYVESDKYFERDQIYGYEDDQDRFAYFSKALLEYTKKINFEPDIIHVNDYHTSLVPVLLKTEYARDPFFSQVRTLLTIHNLGNQGIDALHLLDVVGLKGNSTPNLALDTRDGDIDLLDEGIAEADIVVAVSPTYSKEILTPEYGEGLQDLLQRRQDRLFGVLNGIDTEVYNPEVDPNLVSKYSLNKLSDRAANKSALVQEFSFEEKELPIIGMVTRIVGQKGFDLVLEIGEQIGQLPLNLVILGLGDKTYEQGLTELAKKFPNIKVDLEFSEAKSRRIYAGSDFFLIPSRFEPCGLTQMIAMRYGAIPIVRQTGGLADTVTEGKTGVVFSPYKSSDLLKAIQEALEIYKDKPVLSDLQQRGMRQDFSWHKSANEYVNLYQKALKLPMKLP